MSAAEFVALLRLYRLTCRQRAVEAHEAGQFEAALTWHHAAQDATAGIEYLIEHSRRNADPDPIE